MKPVVFITGASRGIGRETALRFAKAGHPVAVNCIHKIDALMELKRNIELSGGRCKAYQGDVKDYTAMADIFNRINQDLGEVSILINNAGISSIGLFQDMNYEDYTDMIHTNLISVMHCCHLAIPSMVRRQTGSIINISSVWGTVGASCEAAYSASKGGINSFTKALGKELAPSGIRVNAVACGAFDTDMNRCLSVEELASLTEQIPAGRLGRAEEAAEMIFAISQGHPYLNGQVIALDGGWI